MVMDMDPLEESGTEPPTAAPTRSPSPPNGGMPDFFANFSLGDPPKKANGKSPLAQEASPGSVTPTKDESPVKLASPAKVDTTLKEENGVAKEESKEEPSEKKQEDAVQPPKKGANLMKELQNDVQQGAMEFNMDNFF